MKKIVIILGFIWAIFAALPSSAQHTLGIQGGYGMGTARLYPKQEMRSRWGMYTAGLSWRYYGTQKFAGGFGIDVEWLQSGFSFDPYGSIREEDEKWQWYTREVNTIQVPIIWQPHFYIKKRVRVYLEAAATFSYRFKSSYENEIARDNGKDDWQGEYVFKTARDNRWGYGLAGGGGFAVLIRQFEVGARVRYYFGLGDLMRNRNKYADNKNDGSENPFWYTPLRSPLDNLTISFTVAYRFNKDGFDVWKLPKKQKQKSDAGFNYKAN